jgi:S-adenosylmethionine hydrolase
VNAKRVTLLTDFGTRDGYAAAMHGVIAGIAPDATVIDASHDIDSGDVEAAAWTLAGYAGLYPQGTIHVVVVDPGVGSSRRAIAARSGGQTYVAPDNGVLTRVLGPDAEVFEIQERSYMRTVLSWTFHGRDIFAPAAAHIAVGITLEQLGPRALGITRLDIPEAFRTHGGVEDVIDGEHTNAIAADVITGDVVHIDRFGNLITNIPASWLVQANNDDSILAEVGSVAATLVNTYAEVVSGSLLAYIGSAGTLEIGVRDGSAAADTNTKRGARVTVRHTGAIDNSV